MIEERVTKAKQASFVLRQDLSTSQNVSVYLYMSLFDKQIEPILQIWMSFMGNAIL